MEKIKDNRGYIFIFFLTLTLGFTFQWWGPFFDGGKGVLSTAVKNINFLPGNTTIAAIEGVWFGLSVGIALLLTSCAGAAIYCKYRIRQRDYETIQDPETASEKFINVFNVAKNQTALSEDDDLFILDLKKNKLTKNWMEMRSSTDKNKYIKDQLTKPSFYGWIKIIQRKFEKFDWKKINFDNPNSDDLARIDMYVHYLKTNDYVERMARDEWVNMENAPEGVLEAFACGSKKVGYVKEFSFLLELISDDSYIVPEEHRTRLQTLFFDPGFYNDINIKLLSGKKNTMKFKILITSGFFCDHGIFSPDFMDAIKKNPEILHQLIIQYSAYLQVFVDKLLLIAQEELPLQDKSELTQSIIFAREDDSTDKKSFRVNMITRLRKHKKDNKMVYNPLIARLLPDVNSAQNISVYKENTFTLLPKKRLENEEENTDIKGKNKVIEIRS